MRRLCEAGPAQSEETKLCDQSIARNEDMKKITGWAATLFAPSLIDTVYGMNFISRVAGHPTGLLFFG